MSGKEKAWPIALGISGSFSFHGEGRKLHWRQLDFWLGGIGWRIKKQVSHGALLLQNFLVLVIAQKQGGFSSVFLPCSSVEILSLLDKDVIWDVMPGELVK